jgi:hypothetical protein
MRCKWAVPLIAAVAVFAQQPAKGPALNTGVTVFPVLVGNRAIPEAGEVLALLLERGGIEDLELSSDVFPRPEAATLEQVAMAFGEFVREHPIQTENALYAEFLVTPGAGFTEVRGILVDRFGHTVWTDRQTAQDDVFKQAAPRDPMACMALLLERLQQPLKLQDPTRKDAPEGKFARRYAARTGLPTEAERGAMRRRLEVARLRFAESHVAVFPILIGNQVERTQAAHVAEVLTREKLGNVEVAAAEPVLQPPGGPNEQKRLWDLARAFRQYVRDAQPAADYAVYAEYGVDRARERAFFVHFVVCDRSGEWVMVEMFNDHHPVFQSVAPRSADDCDRLVALRLADHLRK